MNDETTPSTGGDVPPPPGDPVTAETQQEPTTAPEAYQWTIPEGVSVNPTALSAFGDAAKELGLPQDQAQSIIDRVAPAMAKAQEEQAQAIAKEWAAAAEADTEIGGDKLPETLAVAKKALNEFGSPALAALLDASGLGSHPEVIRMLAKAGRALGPDTIPARGAGPGNDGRSVAQRLFSSMPNP